MKLLYLHQYFVPPDGAGGVRSYEFAKHWIAQGHQVTMITSSAYFPQHYHWPKRINCIEIDGIDCIVIRSRYSNQTSYLRRMTHFFSFMLQSSWVALRQKADAMLATSTPLTIAVPALLYKWLRRKPYIFEVRDLWPELPIAMGALNHPALIWIARKLEHLAYSKACHVIALSPGMAEGVAATGYDAAKITVIPNRANVAFFQDKSVQAQQFLDQYPQLHGKQLVVYCGTVGRINGVQYLVELAAACKAKGSDVQFIVVGAGHDLEVVLQMARARGVWQRNFWHLAPIDKQATADLLQAATVITSLFIDLPAMQHNSANKFFDGLAAGKPICINYGGWQADLLNTHQAGITLDAPDIQQAVDSLLALLQDQKTLKKMGDNALSLAKAQFDLPVLARVWERVLAEHFRC